MTYPISGAELIAPWCIDAAKMKDQPHYINSHLEVFDWFTLDEGSTLPAFTWYGLCRDFVRTYWTGDSHTMPRPLNRSVFALAEVLEYLDDVKRVVFDPVATRAGVWTHPQRIATARYCRRLAEEMRLDLEKSFKEAEAQVSGDWSKNPDDLLQIKELSEPSVSKVVRDAHARIAEEEVKDS